MQRVRPAGALRPLAQERGAAGGDGVLPGEPGIHGGGEYKVLSRYRIK